MRQRYVREIERIFQEKLDEIVAKIHAGVDRPATPTEGSAGSSTGGATSVAGDATTTPSGSPTPGPSITAPEASRTSGRRASAPRPAIIDTDWNMADSWPTWIRKLAEGRSETPQQTNDWIRQFVLENYGPRDDYLEFYKEQYLGDDDA